MQATKKITRAFELIAASQIVRAQGRIAANRPYREGMSHIVVEAAEGDPAAAARFLSPPASPTQVGVLAIVGDRGLSGPYNAGVLRATERLLADLARRQATTHLFTVGKKAQSYFRFRGHPIEASFVGMSDRPTYAQAREVSLTLTTPFLHEDFDLVLLVSTRYLSAGRQTVEARRLLPLVDLSAPPAEGLWDPESVTGFKVGEETAAAEFRTGYTEFEPDFESLLGQLIPQAIESEVFTALLEASASEHTARQRAMAAATENADDLITTLSRIMNRERQDSITTEIMEIVGGAEALRSSKGA